MLHFRTSIFRIVLLSFALLSAGSGQASAAESEWTAGVELPSKEALASSLYIRSVPAAENAKLAFSVTEDAGVSREQAPVRGGIPFARGELSRPDCIWLLDSYGNVIPVQGRVTSVWPEGSVRWLCIDFLTDIAAGQSRQFTLEYGTDLLPSIRTNLPRSATTITTKDSRFVFSPGNRLVQISGKRKIEVVGLLEVSHNEPAQSPESVSLRVDEVSVIERGPVQTTVYLRGAYGDERVEGGVPKFPAHVFVRVYYATGRMEVIHSFGFNGDENHDFVRRYGLVLRHDKANTKSFTYGGEHGRRADAPLTKKLTLTQNRHNTWELSGDLKTDGKRFGGWASIDGASGQTTIGLRNAWQQWPVTLEAKSDGSLALFIYGATDGQFLDLRYQGQHFGKSKSMYVGETLSDRYFGGSNGRAMGLLKISELVIDFGEDVAAAGQAVHTPLVPFVGPERIAQTKALGHIGTYAGAEAAGFGTEGLQRWANGILDFPVVQHEANGLYGWVDWPDQADCEPPVEGKFDMIMQGGLGWTNSERALPSYYFHYAAGGPEKYLRLGHAMALHTIGIDMEHPGGEARPGMTHRHNQVHWREPSEPRQCGIRGWVADYWMTGNPEIYRILTEVFWPNLDYGPIPGDGPHNVVVCNKAGSWNLPNLLAYLTTGDPFWIKHHKAIDAAIYEAASQGLDIPDQPWSVERQIWTGRMKWHQGKIELKNCHPGKIAEYWLTYGGDDRLAEHASLFGYGISLKALKAWGDSYWGDGQMPPRMRDYESPENGAAAYYRLTGNRRALHHMEYRIRRGGRAISAKPFEWDNYNVNCTADQWHKYVGQAYGMNGFKIVAANVFESIYTLGAIEHAAKAKKP